MNNNINGDEQLKLHIEKRNDILLKLQCIYTRNHHSSDIDDFRNNLPDRSEKSQSPIVEDLFIEMYGKMLNDNTDCYRCKHFLNVPQNLFRSFEKISDYTEQCEADLNFVQAIVWLKSATAFTKDISIEQFHLVFHKQWANLSYTQADFDHHNRDSIFGKQGNALFESLNSSNSLITQDDNQKSKASFVNVSEDDNSIHLLRLNDNRRYSTQKFHCQRDINQKNYISAENENNSKSFCSLESHEESLSLQTSTEDCGTLYNRVIPDSDAEYSSSSDIFKDSSQSQEANEATQNDTDNKLLIESDFIAEKSADIFSLNSRNNSTSKETLETRNDYVAISDTSDSLDVTFFNEDFSLSKENCHRLKRQLSSKSNKRTVPSPAKPSDFNFSNKNQSRRIVNAGSPQKDSAYDTYHLTGERSPTSNRIQIEDISIFSSEKIDDITPYQKCESINGTRDSEFLSINATERDVISDRNQQLRLSSSSQRNDESGDLTGMKYSQVAPSCTQIRCSQDDKDSFEGTGQEESRSKRRKLKSVCGSMWRMENEKEDEKISSEWLKFTIDSLNVDEIALQSVRLILLVLQNEKMAKQYRKERCWKDTLEEQALNAVLNFCDVYEAENRTNVCTQEILQLVIGTIDRIIKNSELNKVTTYVHQITIILKLCTSIKVCIETINYLIEKLKSYESVLIALVNDEKAILYSVMSQLHIIFYALTICLKNYRLVFPNERNDEFAEETIPPVVDLWRRQLKFEGTIVEDNAQTRERRWLMILNNFTVLATEHLVQFAEKSQKLVDLLAYKKPGLFSLLYT